MLHYIELLHIDKCCYACAGSRVDRNVFKYNFNRGQWYGIIQLKLKHKINNITNLLLCGIYLLHNRNLTLRQCIGGVFMLKVQGVTKKYGKVLAVDNMGFNVEEGQIAVLLGPNGAGKSTIIKCIAGLLQFHGEITIGGIKSKEIEAKKILGYVPETAALFDSLSVEEHIHFIAKAYKIKDYQGYASELFQRFDLSDKTDKLGRELSKGMQQKVSICCGVITSPKVILFDEPMIGLDPKAIKELKKLFVELKEQGCSVLISTHIIDTIKEIWDKILIMDKGTIVSSIFRDDVKDEEEIEKRFFAVTGGTK